VDGPIIRKSFGNEPAVARFAAWRSTYDPSGGEGSMRNCATDARFWICELYRWPLVALAMECRILYGPASIHARASRWAHFVLAHSVIAVGRWPFFESGGGRSSAGTSTCFTLIQPRHRGCVRLQPYRGAGTRKLFPRRSGRTEAESPGPLRAGGGHRALCAGSGQVSNCAPRSQTSSASRLLDPRAKARPSGPHDCSEADVALDEVRSHAMVCASSGDNGPVDRCVARRQSVRR